jgi:flagellin
MALSVLNNVPSLVAQNNLAVTNNNLQNTLFQLSSGSRINSGADDPAGLSIVNGLQANISALTQSSQNATDGVGQLQVADGALSQVTTLLNRAVTLATEAANGGLTSDQFAAITNEYASITAEIDRIGNATNFNGTSVFQGATTTNPNQVASTASSNLAVTNLLTAGDTTTVQLGDNPAYTFTASATQHENLNQLEGATLGLVGGDTIANGHAMTITTGTGPGLQSYTYTAAGGTGTVTQLMADINAAGIGVNATLNSTGQLVLTDAEGNNDIAVSANTVAEVGAITNATSGSTVQDLINGINASGLGVTASLASVTNPNELVSHNTVTGAGVITAGGTLTLNSGTETNGVYANTFTYTASATTPDTVAGTPGNNTVQGLIDAINNSGTSFHAYINGSNNLEITDGSYSGNITTTGSLAGAGTPGTFGSAGSIQQLEITDPQNRGNLSVQGNDAVLGFVANTNGNPLEGGNADSFVAPSMTGSGGAKVFISDGEVTNPLYNTISVQVGLLSASQIGSNTTTLASQDLGTSSGAAAALTVINNAISDVAAMRGTIGAGINRLNSATNVINTQIQNLTSAQSSIQDANIGTVVANLSKYQVLEQTGISALAQANQNEQAVLKLLQ